MTNPLLIVVATSVGYLAAQRGKGSRAEGKFRPGEILILDSPHTRGIPGLEYQEVNFRGYLGATDAVVVAPEGGQMSVSKAWLSRKKVD